MNIKLILRNFLNLGKWEIALGKQTLRVGYQKLQELELMFLFNPGTVQEWKVRTL